MLFIINFFIFLLFYLFLYYLLIYFLYFLHFVLLLLCFYCHFLLLLLFSFIFYFFHCYLLLFIVFAYFMYIFLHILCYFVLYFLCLFPTFPLFCLEKSMFFEKFIFPMCYDRFELFFDVKSSYMHIHVLAIDLSVFLLLFFCFRYFFSGSLLIYILLYKDNSDNTELEAKIIYVFLVKGWSLGSTAAYFNHSKSAVLQIVKELETRLDGKLECTHRNRRRIKSKITNEHIL